MYGEEGINKAAEFMRDNYELFTTEQIQDICASIFMYLKAGTKAICIYCGADLEKVKPIIDPAVKAVAEGIKTGANIFDRVKIDIDALNSCKVEGYNPFKVTTYEMA